MKNTLWVLCFMFICVSREAQSQISKNAAVGASVAQTDPEKDFLNPPESAKPGVMWMWMGSNLRNCYEII